MACAVGRHELREFFFAQVGVRVVVVVFLVFVLRVEGLVLERVLRLVGEIIGHARHGSRTAAGVEPRARHEVESSDIGIVLRGQRDVFRDGVVREAGELVPVHEVRVHIQEAHAVVLGDGLRVVVCAVLLEAVRELVAENGGDLVGIAVQSAHEAPVDRDVIRRVAGRVEYLAVVDAPDKRERVVLQRVVRVVHEAVHDLVDDGDVVRVAVTAVLLEVLLAALYLRMDVVAHGEHRGERRLVSTVDAECLRGGSPYVDGLGARHRQGQ